MRSHRLGEPPDFPRVVTYRLTVPKFDNSGERIDPAVIERYAREVSSFFGGVSVVPDIVGCYITDHGQLQCEQNARLEATAVEETETQGERNKGFAHDLAARIGRDLGQESIFEVEERDISRQFVPGIKSEHVPEQMLYRVPARALFDRLLGK